jgi:twitching motility protein PilI
MAVKTSLREYQAAVSARLKDAANQAASASSMLGFVAGSQNWLINLQQVAEVFPVVDIVPVPLTQDYFIGVCNVRGSLYSVVDFSALNGGAPTKPAVENRLLLLPGAVVQGAALLVNRMAGLRNPELFTSEALPPGAQAWVSVHMRDAEQQLWQMLDLDALVHHQSFLSVAK